MGEGLIEPCDPVKKAAGLSALIEGVVSQSRIMNDPEPMKALPQLALEFLRPKVPVAS